MRRDSIEFIVDYFSVKAVDIRSYSYNYFTFSLWKRLFLENEFWYQYELILIEQSA